MFNFLNPAMLFAAMAAVIPLIIHLFSRRKVKVVEFSSIRHLKAMQRRQVRRLKIRHEVHAEDYLGFVQLACVIICFRRARAP